MFWLLVALVPLVLGGALLFGGAGALWPDPRTELGRAILSLRLNRVLCGFVVGAGLATAGAIYAPPPGGLGRAAFKASGKVRFDHIYLSSRCSSETKTT